MVIYSSTINKQEQLLHGHILESIYNTTMKMTESLVHNLETAMKMSELKKINSVRVILY